VLRLKPFGPFVAASGAAASGQRNERVAGRAFFGQGFLFVVFLFRRALDGDLIYRAMPFGEAGEIQNKAIFFAFCFA
jgi:hypothetical protein